MSATYGNHYRFWIKRKSLLVDITGTVRTDDGRLISLNATDEILDSVTDICKRYQTINNGVWNRSPNIVDYSEYDEEMFERLQRSKTFGSPRDTAPVTRLEIYFSVRTEYPIAFTDELDALCDEYSLKITNAESDCD